jgi:hypothetical protein
MSEAMGFAPAQPILRLLDCGQGALMTASILLSAQRAMGFAALKPF